MMIIHAFNPRIGHILVLFILMQELGYVELVYVKSSMKSQRHETRSSMKLTSEGNMYDQSPRN